MGFFGSLSHFYTHAHNNLFTYACILTSISTCVRINLNFLLPGPDVLEYLKDKENMSEYEFSGK